MSREKLSEKTQTGSKNDFTHSSCGNGAVTNIVTFEAAVGGSMFSEFISGYGRGRNR